MKEKDQRGRLCIFCVVGALDVNEQVKTMPYYREEHTHREREILCPMQQQDAEEGGRQTTGGIRAGSSWWPVWSGVRDRRVSGARRTMDDVCSVRNIVVDLNGFLLSPTGV